MEKPFSQSCENNKESILGVIGSYFDQSELILEIGTGTGQHAIYFAEQLGKCYWQTSDQHTYHEGINLRLNEFSKYNLGRPFVLDVTQSKWPIDRCDGVFSANTAHIMSWNMVEKMFQGVGKTLSANSFFCLYGPFNFKGEYTSDSNQTFDKSLREDNPESGIRNFEDLQKLAQQQGLEFVKRHDMPANNYILVWQQPSS